MNEKSEWCELPRDETLAELAALSRADALILARHQLLALSVVESAWRSAGLPDHRNRLRGEGAKHRNSRFGCVSGSSLGGLAAMEVETASPKYRPSPYSLTRWRGNSITAVTTLRYGLGAADFSINAASATGAQALFLAGMMIRSGLADLVVATAADVSQPPLLRETMVRNGSVAKNHASLPLSSSRSGMRPAEGAGCLILESEDHASARGATFIAEWVGGSCANEACHLMAPDDSAFLLEESIRSLGNQYLSPGSGLSRIDWLSLHATGTSRFDKAEMGCLKRLFPEKLPWISALKRITGHALGASGLIEASLLAEGLNRGEVPPWPSLIDPALGLDGMKPVDLSRPELALQIAQGMGGTLVLNLLAAQ